MRQSSPYGNAAAITSLGRYLNPSTWVSPFQMPFRFHIWTDGSIVRSAFFFRGSWSPGPDLSFQDLKEGDILSVHILAIIEKGFQGKSVGGIGLILHVADEIATCPLRDEFLQEAELKYAQTAIVTEPLSIVEDVAPPDENTWRILPIARQHTMAIRLTTERGRILGNVRNAMANAARRSRTKTAVRVAMVSSPLAALAALPVFYQPDNLDLPRTHIVCLVYTRFTAIAVFDSAGELVEFNALSHGVRTSPQGFGQRVQNHMTRYGTETNQRINLTLVQMGHNDLQLLIDDLKSYAAGAQELFQDTRIEIISGPELQAMTSAINLPSDPWFSPEFCAYDLSSEVPPQYIIKATTIASLRSAAESNFYTPQIMAAKGGFTKGEALAYLLLGYWNILAFLGLILSAGALGVFVLASTQEPAWNLDQSHAAEVEQARQRIIATNAALASWDDLMISRSRGWEAMEFLNKLFPDSAPVILRKMRMEVRGLNPDPSVTTPDRVGFSRSWTMEGVASGEFLGVIEAEALASAYQSVAMSESSTYQLFDRRLVMDIKRGRIPTETINGMQLDTKWQASILDRIENVNGKGMPLGVLLLPLLDEPTIAGWEALAKKEKP